MELAERQHVVFSLDQARALGFNAAVIQRRARAGALHRIHHTVYSLVPVSRLSRRGLYMAAVLACGVLARLSHRDSGLLHEIRPTQRMLIDITVPGRSCRRHPGIDLHRSTTLTEADVTVIDGIPCTSLARTYLDLAGVIGQRDLERAFEQGEVLQTLDWAALEDQIARNPKSPSAAKLRRAMDSYLPGDLPTESELEEALFAMCRARGLPVPRRQFWIDTHDGEPMVRLDFAWPEYRFAVETDGGRFHNTIARFESDRRKQQRLMRIGWRVMWITWRQLRDDPARIATLIVDQLAVAV